MKFLVPVDGSEASLRAVSYLVRLAKCREVVEIQVLNVREPADAWEIRRFLNAEEIARMQQNEGEVDLSEARALLDMAGVAYDAQVLVGPVAQTIARFATAQGCDSIVMGTHGRGGLTDLFLGSVAAKVVHLSALPVTLIK
jgi:nucleotide-binding universal stress UspA family protein